MTVLDATKVDIRSGSQKPAIKLSKDVEDALWEVLMGVDIPPVQGLARVGVDAHPVPLLNSRWTTRGQDNLSTAFYSKMITITFIRWGFYQLLVSSVSMQTCSVHFPIVSVLHCWRLLHLVPGFWTGRLQVMNHFFSGPDLLEQEIFFWNIRKIRKRITSSPVKWIYL